jgi:hypothetical protein
VNTLALHVELRPDGDLPEVRVLIDGRDLVDLVREVEAPWAAADGQPQIAGGYSGLWPAAWLELPEQDGTGRAAVLACECGEVGCWPLHVRITVSDSTVTWSEFSQPCRPEWRYDGLGPFVFERAAYERAIQSVTADGSARDV